MYIAIDGVDGCGKTTLIQELVAGPWRYQRTQVVKLLKPKSAAEALLNERVHTSHCYYTNTNTILIQDRSLLTTAVYSMLEYRISKKRVWEHLIRLQYYPRTIIYLDCPPDIAWTRKSDMYSKKFIQKVYNKYEEVITLAEHFTKVIRIDATKKTKEQVMEVLNAIF